jgi:hypothetical protein
LHDPRDGRRGIGNGIVFDHGAGVDADRVGSADVVIRTHARVGGPTGRDDNRAGPDPDPVPIAVDQDLAGNPGR